MNKYNESPRDIGVIVSRDRNAREEILAALHPESVQVLVCPGPCGPGNHCLGDREGGCPFIGVASFVVLDAPTHSDVDGFGTSALELVRRYRDAGRPVVVLASAYEDVRAFRAEGAEIVLKPIRAQEVRDAIHTVTRSEASDRHGVSRKE